MFQIIASGGIENHEAVKAAFANLVQELRKAGDIEARYLSMDGHAPDHVVHPKGGHTGENPQIISGNQDEVA